MFLSMGTFSALKHARMLILSNYVFLISINTIYNIVTHWRFSEMYVKFQFWGHRLYIFQL